MIGEFKTPMFVDRRVYDKRGKWLNPNTKLEENIFYYIKEAPTLVSDYVGGNEEIKLQYSIVVYGGKPICAYDEITLEDGKKLSAQAPITCNYVEHNILVKDLLKPMIRNMEITLMWGVYGIHYW